MENLDNMPIEAEAAPEAISDAEIDALLEEVQAELDALDVA